jgi:AcrR family transcriptional regulator
MSRPRADKDTAQRILDIATQLVQTRGFNGFSYADVAAQLQVTKASLHYHFASKAELGRRLIERYDRSGSQRRIRQASPLCEHLRAGARRQPDVPVRHAGRRARHAA